MRPGFFNYLPPAVKNLLIINGLFFLATIAFAEAFKIDLTRILGMPYFRADTFMPYQVITHVFMHGSFFHIASNMFALWMFGSILENNAWGTRRFLFFYFFTAFGAVILHQLVLGIEIHSLESAYTDFTNSPTVANLSHLVKKLNINNEATYISQFMSQYGDGGVISGDEVSQISAQVQGIITLKKQVPTVGASGAVFGLLIAFAMYYPNTELFLLFVPIPIKAKYFVSIYALIELYLGIQNSPQDNIAHFAHLGGALFGFLLIKYWNKTNRKSFY